MTTWMNSAGSPARRRTRDESRARARRRRAPSSRTQPQRWKSSRPTTPMRVAAASTKSAPRVISGFEAMTWTPATGRCCQPRATANRPAASRSRRTATARIPNDHRRIGPGGRKPSRAAGVSAEGSLSTAEVWRGAMPATRRVCRPRSGRSAPLVDARGVNPDNLTRNSDAARTDRPRRPSAPPLRSEGPRSHDHHPRDRQRPARPVRLPRRHRLPAGDEARPDTRDRSRRSAASRKSRSGCSSSGSARTTTSSSARCPTWTDGLDRIDFDKIVYYRKPSEREEKSWDDVPEQIKATFEKLGIPEAERKFLAGVGAQYDSEVVYHSVKEELTKIGVVFMGTDQALKDYPEIFKQVLRHRRPARGQQVRGAQQRGLVGRLVRVRAQGRRGPAAAAGLLPHQRREHRPVRADADRRRGGRQGPLHRGLHGARSTRPTRSTPRSSRSSRCRARRCATRRSRTGRTTSTTS